MKSFEEMKAIYVAIKLGDTSEARKTAMQHVANARASAKKTFAVK